MNYTSESFEAGSEFRVAWEIARPNPRYNPFMSRAGRTSHREIITNYTSPVFDSYEAAIEFIETTFIRDFRVQVRRPGKKTFVPTYNAHKVEGVSK